jgi:virginiamycin B lyase
MTLGPGFEIKNCTQWPLTISLDQTGPLYYGLVQPGETFVRDTGAVWFTIKAIVSPDNVSHINDWDCIMPVAGVVGAVLFAAITGGYGAFAAVGASVGASALAAGGAVSLSAIVIEGAVGAAGSTMLTAGMAVKLLGDVFAKNGGASRWGMYAGPPWPFREDRKQLSVVGGPVASATSDGKLKLSEGTPLQIVDHFQEMPRPKPIITNWASMPGTLKTMSMIRRGLMMGVNDAGGIYHWDGAAWTSVPGNLRSISAASDNTVWGVNNGNTVYRWANNTWAQMPGSLKKVTVGAVNRVWGIDMNDRVSVWNGNAWSVSQQTSASDGAGASDGTLWHIGSSNRLYRSDPNTGATIEGPMDANFTLDRISVGSANLIWGVRSGKVFRRDGTSWTEIPVPEPFSEVTVSSDGAVCGIAASKKIYTYTGH